MDNLITDERLANSVIFHAMTTCKWGHMKRVANKGEFSDKFNVPKNRLLGLNQVHGNKILTIYNERDFNKYKSKKHKADGWILSLKNCAVTINTCDCLPLFLWDRQADTLGLAHCGWRSIAKELPLKIAKKMLKLKASKRPLYAFMAPHIKPCCFKVGKKVAEYFPKTAVKISNNKFSVDLAKEVRYQLISAGIASIDIKIHSECTCCNPKKYFSYRRDNRKNSMMSILWKK